MAARARRRPEHVDGALVPAGLALRELATDGVRLVASAWGDTLVVRQTDRGVVVDPEPDDDGPGWEDIPDRALVTVEPHGPEPTDLAVTCTPLTPLTAATSPAPLSPAGRI